MPAPSVSVSVASCLGVQSGPGDVVAMVFVKTCGGLHVVEMPLATALAAAFAALNRIEAPPIAPAPVGPTLSRQDTPR